MITVVYDEFAKSNIHHPKSSLKLALFFSSIWKHIGKLIIDVNPTFLGSRKIESIFHNIKDLENLFFCKIKPTQITQSNSRIL
jgi:hypothetical protein